MTRCSSRLLAVARRSCWGRGTAARRWKMRFQPANRAQPSCGLLISDTGLHALVNVLFLLQRLRDPFTMYKVFRRDCLYGLEFCCNRFDFDIELLVKLLRKGYRPLEIPVNYRSRSFKSGKKVNPVRDPWTWLWALLKLRFIRVDPLRRIQESGGRKPGVQEPPLELAGRIARLARSPRWCGRRRCTRHGIEAPETAGG